MINVDMSSTEGVTLATAGKYCADNIRVTPSCIPNYKKFTGEIVSTVTGEGAKALLITDPAIAEHYMDESLVVTVTFDDFCTYDALNNAFVPYTLVQSIGANSTLAFNKQYAMPSNGIKQMSVRWASSTAASKGFTTPIYSTTEGVGALQVDSSGNLYIIVDSTNFAVRPSAYTVEVVWGE